MITVLEYGDIPPQAYHEFRCHSCRSALGAETSDAHTISNAGTHWYLSFKCPLCGSSETIAVNKPNAQWDKSPKHPDAELIIAEPEGGKTF